MKRHIKAFSHILVVPMIIGLLSGCNGNSKVSPNTSTKNASTVSLTSTQNSLPIVKEKKTFKVAVFKHSLDKTKSFNEKEAFIRAEKDTNIHIEFIEVLAGTQNEKVPIMLASDLPDAFMGNLLTESLVSKNQGQLVALNDLLKTYAPNISNQYEKVPNMWDMLKFPDGKIYTLATDMQISRDNDGDAIMFMNKKWLDKVGKKIPTTTDELYDVLKAFKNGDPNGNGKNDEIPLEFCENNWAGGIIQQAGPWGITGFSEVKNGKFTPAVDTDNFRKFLEFYNKLATEGLLDVEGFTQTNQQFYAKLKQYVCGSYTGWTPQSNLDSATAKEYTQVLPIALPGKEGIQAKIGEWNKFRGNRTGFAITTACKDKESMLRWWDYLASSKEMKFTIAYGKEGKIWERDSSGQVWSIYPEVTADYTRENMKYTEGYYGGQPLILEEEMEKNNGEKYPDSVMRFNMSTAVKKYLKTENLPIRFVPEDKTSEKALIETDLNTYMKNFIATSIINGIDDAKWKTHLTQLEKLNIKGWTKWHQDFIDKKF